MKILYVITGLAQGGAERVVCDLADKMHEKGNQVKIAYLTGEILTSPIYTDIELIKINLNSIRSLPLAYIRLLRLIKAYKPDVVHAHMVHANILTRLARLLSPMNKLICTAHSSNEGGSLRMVLYRLTNSLADLTTNVSNTAVSSFEKKYAVPKNSMRVVYNGINFDSFGYQELARNEVIDEFNLFIDTKIILAAGRFNESKNYPNLLKAAKILKDKHSMLFNLLIAGDGELRDDLENMILKLGLKNEVKLLGRRKDIPRLMSACDVFVLSSDYEGLPTVLIEAFACQAQVVSTDVSGVREIVNNHGNIVPAQDSVALAEALVDILDKVNNSKNILGYQHAKEKFDLNIISNEWLKIYNEI